MLTWKQFNEIPNGTQVINHGWDQCVALANLYHESVIGGSFVGVPSAYMWWTQYSSWETLTDNYRPSQTPVAGAIFISRYGLYDAPNGHIGVVTSVNGNGTFNTMEQNAGTWRYVGRYHRSTQDVLGFLVPKNNPSQEDTMTPAQEKKLDKVITLLEKMPIEILTREVTSKSGRKGSLSVLIKNYVNDRVQTKRVYRRSNSRWAWLRKTVDDSEK